MLDVQQIAEAALAEKGKREAAANTEANALCEYYKAERAWGRLFERAATLTLPDEEAGEILLAVAESLAARHAGPQVERFAERASGDYKHALQHVAAVLLEAMKLEATAVEIGRLWNSAKGWTRHLHDAASRAYEALHRPDPEPAASDRQRVAAVAIPVVTNREPLALGIGPPTPPAEAFQAYWLQQAGKSQTEIGEMLKKRQGTISRWIAKVEKWKEAGNAMPEIPKAEPLAAKPAAIDPAKLDLGPRSDHRAPHQSEKLAGIQGHGWEE